MFKGKYLAGMLAAYTAVFVVCFYIPLTPSIHLVITMVFLLAFGMSIFVKNKRLVFDTRRILIFSLAAVLFLFSFGYSEWFCRTKLVLASEYADGELHDITATVEDIRYEGLYASSYVLHITSIDEEPFFIGALLDIPVSGGLDIGNEIIFMGTVNEITDEYQYYQKSRGILVICSSDTFTQISDETAKISIFDRIREMIVNNFETYIGGKSAGYATALLIGDRDALDGQTSLAYQRLGISHVLAVSGLHFSVIIGGMDFILRILTVSKKRKNLFLILFSLFFAAICGFSASIARAVIMFVIYYIADSLGEKSDSVTSLFFAAACMITVRPWLVFDAGLWLSVCSTLGILVWMHGFQGIFVKQRSGMKILGLIKKFLRALLCALGMTIVATFFTMPVTYLLYGGVSLISPLSNLIFVPLTELILYLLVILTLFGFVPYLAPLLGKICGFLIELADHIARRLSDIHGIYVSIRYPFASVILVALILGMLVVLLAKEFRLRRMITVIFVSVLAFCVCFCVYRTMETDSSYLYLQTDGKNDMLGIVDHGEVMLVDVTNGGKRMPMMAVETLSEYYCCEIDTYLVTHLHSYHVGTLKTLADTIKIHRILLPEAETEKDAEYIEKITEALRGTCEIVYYRRDGTESVSVGDTVLNLPAYETINRSEHPVIAFSADMDGIGAWIYCGSSSMEFSERWENVRDDHAVIFGAHGPVVKNIFDETCLSSAELIVFSSADTMELVDLEKLQGETRYVEGEYHIRFQYKN